MNGWKTYIKANGYQKLNFARLLIMEKINISLN